MPFGERRGIICDSTLDEACEKRCANPHAQPFSRVAGAPFDRLYGDLYLCFGQGLRRFEPKSSRGLDRGDQEIANTGKHPRSGNDPRPRPGSWISLFRARGSLDELVCDLREGPRMSSVVDCIVERTGDDTGSFTDFSIRP